MRRELGQKKVTSAAGKELRQGDPGDEMVLEAAVNGRARAIVTFNRRHYAEVPRAFGIEILLPAEALRRIQA